VIEPLVETEAVAVVELRIPAKAEWVAVARLAVAAVASRSDFSVEEIEDIRLAIAEACTNVIRDADPGMQIDIRCQSARDSLSVTVRGGAAVRLRVDGSEAGLGVIIIQSLMDSVEYLVETNGVVLSMVKRVQPR
jgi:serine/threonine-protein kinase RsbW